MGVIAISVEAIPAAVYCTAISEKPTPMKGPKMVVARAAVRPLRSCARRFWGYLPLAWTLFVRRPKNTDLLLVAVKPEYQGKGVNALIIADLIPTYKRLGYRYAESNPELETNAKVQSQWDYFDHVQHKRRRCWVKEI